MSLTLYFAPGSSSTIAHAVMEEAGLPYQLVRLEPRQEHDRPVGELSLYPSERISALAHDDFVLFETGAILLHLLSFPEAAHLIPRAGTREHLRFLRWLFFFEATLQPTLIDAMNPERWTVDDRDFGLVRDKAVRRVYAKLNLLEANVSSGSVLYDGFSALDIYLTGLARWCELAGLSISLWRGLDAIVTETRSRPAYRAMMEKQGISWPGTDSVPRTGLKRLGLW